MKREIKFRMFRDGKMQQVHTMYSKAQFIEDSPLSDSPDYNFNFGEDKIMQFVGIYDKNGNQIYEGDIVTVDPHSIIGGGSWTEQTCVVSFINGSFVVDSSKFHSTICRIKSYLTVIGNIYENPELIEAIKVEGQTQ